MVEAVITVIEHQTQDTDLHILCVSNSGPFLSCVDSCNCHHSWDAVGCINRALTPSCPWSHPLCVIIVNISSAHTEATSDGVVLFVCSVELWKLKKRRKFTIFTQNFWILMRNLGYLNYFSTIGKMTVDAFKIFCLFVFSLKFSYVSWRDFLCICPVVWFFPASWICRFVFC